MGNACINFKRKKRLQEELNFRRTMEERIKKSSKRLKGVPPDQLNKVLNCDNDLANLRKTNLNKPKCTPLRQNSQGVFVEVDQQFIEEKINNLTDLDRQNLINNPNLITNSSLNKWTNQILNQQPNCFYNLSTLNQLRVLQSNPSYRFAALNSFDNKCFINTSIDNNLFDQNFLLNSNHHLNGHLNNQLNSQKFNQQLNQINSQLRNYSSLSSILNNKSQFNDNQFNSNLILNNIELNRSHLNQLPDSNNVLDVAANRIFSELEYMENRYIDDNNELNNKLSNNSCYLPLDGFMRLEKNNLKNFNTGTSIDRFSDNFDTTQIKDLSTFSRNFNKSQINKQQFVNSHMTQNNFSQQLLTIPKLPFSISPQDTIDALNEPRIGTSLDLLPSLNNENFILPLTSGSSNLVSNLNNTFVNKNSTSLDNSMNLNYLANYNDSTDKREANDNKKIYIDNENLETRDYITINLPVRRESIEEELESKDELNDSGNSSGECLDKQINPTESSKNNLINNQIETEPWFFAQINSRQAAEHVLRMKGNRIGAFLVRHAQKIKFTADVPFVLSLKVTDSTIDKHSSSHLQLLNKNESHLKLVNKEVLHYKIYSHLTCSNCELKMFYINPANQFRTIRQLISFYSETENCGLPIKLDKPCLPFDYLNCCCRNSNSPNKTNPNCDICNELMSGARTNRWSTGNVSAGNTSGNVSTSTLTPQLSHANSISSNDPAFQIYIEQNPDAYIKIGKDELNTNSTANQVFSKPLNLIKACSVERISNNGIPVNSSNRILTEIKFEDRLNQLNQFNQINELNKLDNTNNRSQFSSSLDDVGINNSISSTTGLSNRLSLNLNIKDRFRNRSLVSINYSDNISNNYSSGSSLSRKSSDSRKGVRASLLIGAHKLRKVNSCSVNNVSSLQKFSN